MTPCDIDLTEDVNEDLEVNLTTIYHKNMPTVIIPKFPSVLLRRSLCKLP